MDFVKLRSVRKINKTNVSVNVGKTYNNYGLGSKKCRNERIGTRSYYARLDCNEMERKRAGARSYYARLDCNEMETIWNNTIFCQLLSTVGGVF